MTQHPMTPHELIREALLDGLESGGASSDEIAAHLDGCDDCRAFAAALEGVDAHLSALPVLEVDGALLERTLARIAAEPAGEAERREERAGGAFAILAAIGAGLVSGLWALAKLAVAPFRRRGLRRWSLAGMGIAVPAAAALGLVMVQGAPERSIVASGVPMEDAERVAQGATVTRGPTDAPANMDGDGEELDVDLRRQLEAPNYWSGEAVNERGEDQDRGGRFADNGLLVTEQGDMAQATVALATVEAETVTAQPGYLDETVTVEVPPADGRVTAGRDAPAFQTILEARQQAAGQRFWTERDRVEGLTFVEPRGHWASTYVPGDPAMRLVRRRLAAAPDALALADRAAPTELGIDAPASAALSLQLAADRAAVEGPTRVLVSAGVRGAAVRAGRRPTLTAQVVIDARQPLDAEAQARVRALLTALGRRREGSDRAGVIVAGPRGGVLLPLSDLRYGEITVALRRLFAEGASGSPMSLEDAVSSAIASVGQLEDARSPLGSALVIVVSPGLDASDATALEPVAHAGALAGVTTTSLAIADRASIDALDRVALAGQGRRRQLGSIDEADALVSAELAATSQVVARAVRMRIRLAPGVQLVGVIGSRRLDGDETRRVREAERAIDRELARRLGIVSDRDEDEDGIQIVVPAFYADDEHAVLLDVVVPGPGAVADVSLRWKDLVRTGNGSAAARLTLAGGTRAPSPREERVRAQLLSHQLASALRDAARSLDAGQLDAARARLAQARELAARSPGDLALFAAYEAALVPEADLGPLADSLRYASHRRLLGEIAD